MGAGNTNFGRRRGRAWILAIALVVPLTAVTAPNGPAAAEVVRAHNDNSATGWYPNQDKLGAEVVPNGAFGELFSANVNGSVYAQPLVDDNGTTKTLLVETEEDRAYGLDPVSGTQRWERDLDPPGAASPQPWHAADIGCGDLSPDVGVTGTPVIDDATHTEYFTAKEYDASGPSGVIYEMFALDTVTGAVKFRTTIAGEAQNEINGVHIPFDAKWEFQRPGLLLLDGVVYAAFGGHCDHPPYWGFVVGVNAVGHATAGAQTTMWGTQSDGNWGGGVWQAGGALISDRAGSILVATGNGHDPLTAPTLGTQPPGDVDESVVRLDVQPNGTLKPVDFFMPYDAPTLDVRDQDFGSGGPVALPTSFNGQHLFGATSTHPNLMVEVGKAGYVYLLDRDNLGGYRNGPSGGDAALQRLGPTGAVWSTPAVWPGDGGYVYIVHGTGADGTHTGFMRAYKYGNDAHNNPLLNFVGATADSFGFGSGTPVVTSNGTQSGSALVWVIWQPDGTGRNAELRAYDPVPVNGVLPLRWSAPIGQASKFEPPAVEDNRVYVGTRDGHVFGFGSPVDQPFAASPDRVNFPNTIIGNTSAPQTLTFQANHDNTTITAITSTNGAFKVGTPSLSLPATLQKDDTLSLPVRFAPTARSVTGGSIDVRYSIGGAPARDFFVSAEGLGQYPTGDLSAFPVNLSMGGTPIGVPTSTTLTLSNLGAQAITITSGTFPNAPFHTTGLPIGTQIAPGGSVSATVTFSATTAGSFSDAITIHSDAAAPGNNSIVVPVSASAAGPAHLVVTATNTYFGSVRVGSTATRNVKLTNTGQSTMQITKSKPPASGTGFASVGFPLDEASTIGPGQSKTVTIGFSPKSLGHFTDTWLVNGDDDTGLHTLTFDGFGANAAASYWMVDTSGRVYPLGTATGASGVRFPLTAAVSIDPTPTGQGYFVVDNGGAVQTYGNAVYRGSLPSGWLSAHEHVASMSITPSGNGYWLFSSRGRVFPFGDAVSFGDLRAVRLNGPIIASIATPTGAGYYMVGSDGGVFTFGDAHFYGSTGGMRLNKPVVGIVPTATGLGYWLSASDGGVFSFGDAKFRGSMGGVTLNKPVVGIVRYGNGYLMVASDGGIFDFSNSAFVGSLANFQLPQPIVAVGAFAV